MLNSRFVKIVAKLVDHDAAIPPTIGHPQRIFRIEIETIRELGVILCLVDQARLDVPQLGDHVVRDTAEQVGKVGREADLANGVVVRHVY